MGSFGFSVGFSIGSARLHKMTESTFYSELLGLDKPWEVEAVTLDKANLQVLVKVRYTHMVWVCPDTRERVHVHQWNTCRQCHLDTCQFKAIRLFWV